MTRIMVCWGVVSCCMLLVQSAYSFYALRFLLGVFEAGFSPGVMLYLTLWYPRQRISQMTALFLSGSAVAGLIGAPVSGLIMDHANERARPTQLAVAVPTRRHSFDRAGRSCLLAVGRRSPVGSVADL